MKGFTLIELVVTLVVVAIGASVMVVPLKLMADMLVWDRLRNDLVDSSRLAMDRVSRELQNIRSTADISEADLKECLFITAAHNYNSGLKWYEDVDGVKCLMLMVWDGTDYWWMPLSTSTFDIRFSYFDGNGVPLTPLPLTPVQRGQIRTIRLSVDFRSSEMAPESGEYYYLSTEVRPWNLH